jgi:hypothetical protein
LYQADPVQRLPVRRPFGNMRAGHGDGIADANQRLQCVEVDRSGSGQAAQRRVLERIAQRTTVTLGKARVPRGQTRPDGIVEGAFVSKIGTGHARFWSFLPDFGTVMAAISPLMLPEKPGGDME